MKKFFSMKFFKFKKSKGTTIVEVLVSVIIIGVVSMYGLSFFSSSYRFATDSEEYNSILQGLINRIEIAKASVYQTDNTGFEERYKKRNKHDYPSGINGSNAANFGFKKEEQLRTGCTVVYSYTAYENAYPNTGAITERFYGSTKMVFKAEWPKGSGFKNKIEVVTYVANIWPRAS